MDKPVGQQCQTHGVQRALPDGLRIRDQAITANGDVGNISISALEQPVQVIPPSRKQQAVVILECLGAGWRTPPLEIAGTGANMEAIGP